MDGRSIETWVRKLDTKSDWAIGIAIILLIISFHLVELIHSISI